MAGHGRRGVLREGWDFVARPDNLRVYDSGEEVRDG
jgi:hypothetical protein